MDSALVSFAPVPPTLYHYTSLHSLVAIVQSRSIWASNMRFLNDHSESLWLKQQVLASLRNRHLVSSDKDRLEKIIQDIENRPKQSFFVSSFTEKADDLSQWRAYCSSGLGVNIGFSSKCLSEQWVANPNKEHAPFFLHAELKKVQYYSSAASEELEEIIDRLLSMDDLSTSVHDLSGILAPAFLPALTRIAGRIVGIDDSLASSQAIAIWTLMMSPMLKHYAFKEEAEWRKLVSKDVRLMSGQRFREGKSTLVPYVEVLLDSKNASGTRVPQEHYFIDEVIVGPTPSPEMTIEAVHALFATYGHPEVQVRSSEVPFRSW